MVVLLECNINDKSIYANKYTNEGAIEKLNKISRIPPQYRFIVIVDYRLFGTYTVKDYKLLSKYFYSQLPNVNELIKYRSFPVYINKNKEVK